MGKPTGFLEFPRRENPYREVEQRLLDFDDLHNCLSEEERRSQAARCMNCGVPFCQSNFGCPLHNLIPECNELLYLGQEKDALDRLLKTAPFPEFTGHVCPALCEKACNLEGESLTNRDNELYLIETAFSRGWIQPRIPQMRTGKKIAVAGSGPSGLAAADLLNQMGHSVTVWERADRAGGLLMYGIPNMKLPKEKIERRIHIMEQEGISFKLNTEAIPEELREYDAVVLCGGARKARSLNLKNESSKGIYFAVDYLTAATRAWLERKEPVLSARGKRVIVVGGGDTGNDCVGTALRQECLSVTQLEMMPAPPAARPAGNPWPEWPRTLRTDYGQAEAIAMQGRDPRVYETTVADIHVNEKNTLQGVTTVRLCRNEAGRMEPIPGSKQDISCELMLIAAGFVGCEDAVAAHFSLVPDHRGRLMPADGSHYLGGKLFAAGDMRSGQSLVVRALADGRAAAKEVDAFLQEQDCCM